MRGEGDELGKRSDNRGGRGRGAPLAARGSGVWGQGKSVWQAADAGRDMLYDVCSSHRPSLIN